MTAKTCPRRTWGVALLVMFIGLMTSALPARGQAPATAPTRAADDAAKPPVKAEELEQLLAPIALYPDALLTQVLMASTYPLEIVQADRWIKQHSDLKDAALTAELEKQSWDPSVKSLVNFPQVLAMMSEKLDLTIRLGDAFIAQQTDVMNTIQKLRAKAQAEGNLKSNEQQTVTAQPAPPPAEATVVVQQAPPAKIITIESPNPQVIYVPTYNPTYVYGAWPYPAYPPAPYYPPGYVASNMVSFGLGVACGAAWGYAWGQADWGHNDVDIDVNRNTNINNNIDRSKYQQDFQNRQSNRQANRPGQGGQGTWQHNPQHRHGVAYRDQGTAQRYGAANQSRQTSQAREAYRGRAETDRQDLARGGASDFRSGTGANRAISGASGSAGGAGVSNRAGTGSARGAGSAGAAARSDGSSYGSRSSSFDGMDRGGSSARASSQRGQSSRSSSAYSSSAGGNRSAGAARSGGAAPRGGTGRGSGGRR